MKVFFRVIWVLYLFCAGQQLSAQTGFFVPVHGQLFFSGDTATIFSNVINRGKVTLAQAALLNFAGERWTNEPEAEMADSAGMLRFMGSATQYLDGGYNAVTGLGASFYNVSVANSNGVRLVSSTTRIRNELAFNAGHLFTQDQLLVIGDGNPGSITGYTPDRFIVAGNSITGGLLLRENITTASGDVVFPIGSAPGAYTPLSVKLTDGAGDDFYAGLWDGVQSELLSGLSLNEYSVNKTWEIGKRNHPGEGTVQVNLQHLVADEGTIFAQNRQFAFVSQFLTVGWDAGYPQGLPATGALTTGSPLSVAGMNDRVFNGAIGLASYFTKFTTETPVLNISTRCRLAAYRMDERYVWVYWTTQPEVNMDYFVVQRRRQNETDFIDVDTVITKAPGGNSTGYLQYAISDDNAYADVTYYRLLLKDRQGDTSYSNTVWVPGFSGRNNIVVWPNPSTGRFYTGIAYPALVDRVIIWDVAGRRIKEERVQGRGVLEFYLPIHGTYLVSFVAADGKILETKKLIIAGNR